jgi:hypothetical protein
VIYLVSWVLCQAAYEAYPPPELIYQKPRPSSQTLDGETKNGWESDSQELGAYRPFNKAGNGMCKRESSIKRRSVFMKVLAGGKVASDQT